MLVAPPLQPEVVGPFLGMGCMVPQLFAALGNRWYPEFWAVTGGPWFPGYITPTVAPSPPLSRWFEAVTQRWVEQVLIGYCEHFCGIRQQDCGAKASTISTRNLVVVPTV
jgi:hypothetical protein